MKVVGTTIKDDVSAASTRVLVILIMQELV
jgi:hypothetical protein